MPLTGKLALVTGGSGTIGVSIAKALAARGAHVVLTGRTMDKLQTAAQTVQQAVPNTTACPGGVGRVAWWFCEISIKCSLHYIDYPLMLPFAGLLNLYLKKKWPWSMPTL